MPAADQANASQADPPGLTFSVSVSALQHLIIEVLRRPVEFTLFFRHPAELLAATKEPLPVSLFQRDPVSTYNISEQRARADLGIQLEPQVNTGIALFPRASLDLERCNEYLAHPDVARATGWIEQTLHALCASEQKRVAHLPDSYVISLDPRCSMERLVARHYAGPSRRFLTDEGIPRVLETAEWVSEWASQ